MATLRAVTAAAAAITAFAVAGCGGGDNGSDAALEAPPLTVPGYSGTPRVSKPHTAPGADSVKKTTTEAATTEPNTPTQTDAATPKGGNSSDVSSTGGASAQFQDFCANNPGAC